MKFKTHYLGVNFDSLPNTTKTSHIMMQKRKIKPENPNPNPKNLHLNHNPQKSTLNPKFHT
jgi:hypothetical protein